MTEDWIFWDRSYFLTWDDFQGKPIENSPHYAVSANKISRTWQIQYDPKKQKLRFEKIQVNAIFEKSKSWKKVYPALHSEITLRHEQGHFDIAEEFARKIQKILEKELFGKTFTFKVKQGKNHEESANIEAEKIVKKIFEKPETEYNKEHKKYDDDTKHGTELKRQEEYNQRFEKLRIN